MCLAALLSFGVPGRSADVPEEALEDRARSLQGMIEKNFKTSPAYRSLLRSASRLHHEVKSLQQAQDRGDSVQAARQMNRVAFDLPSLTADIYRQQTKHVSTRALGQAMDQINQMSRELRSLQVATRVPSRQPIDPAIRPVSLDIDQEWPISSDPIPVQTDEEIEWDDEYPSSPVVEEWTGDASSFQAGGMQTNTLYRADGTPVDSRFVHRGYWERVDNPFRVPTNWGGDWFDPTRPSRRFGPFGFGGGFGWGYGWSIYSTFGPPYMSFFYSGNYFFSY
jgi:hypothetical protein